jgi:hypothetical protein
MRGRRRRRKRRRRERRPRRRNKKTKTNDNADDDTTANEHVAGDDETVQPAGAEGRPIVVDDTVCPHVTSGRLPHGEAEWCR